MNYIRVVADTNVTVSAFLWGGQPGRLLDLGIDQQITLITSDVLLAELADVLSREQFLPRLLAIGISAKEIVSVYRRFCELAPPIEIIPAVYSDHDDDAVLACAIGGQANVIVTRDAHLLNLKYYHRIPILTVDAFFQNFYR